MKTSSVYEIPADKYNDLLAKALKQIPEFKAPEWSLFVKTGTAKKRPSQEKDFWYKRAASILRQIYMNRVVGVNRLKTRYGSKKNRGMRPERFRKASGKIIRVILQQAEAAGFLEKYNEPGKRAGRQLTDKGKDFLEDIKLDKKPVSISPKESSDKEESLSEEIQEEIQETEKEIAKDVAKGASEKEIKEDIKEAKQEIKEEIKEAKEENKEK